MVHRHFGGYHGGCLLYLLGICDAIEAPAGMLAMQSINRIILKSVFLPIFFGSSLAAAALVVLMLVEPSLPGAQWALAGSGLYFLGMFVVTVVGNVPLNNRLESTDANGSGGSEMWAVYLAKWTVWNHVRIIACTLSLALLIAPIAVRIWYCWGVWRCPQLTDWQAPPITLPVRCPNRGNRARSHANGWAGIAVRAAAIASWSGGSAARADAYAPVAVFARPSSNCTARRRC